MFNVLVNTEYEWLFEKLRTEAPDFFSMKLADFSCPDERPRSGVVLTDCLASAVGQPLASERNGLLTSKNKKKK